MSGTNSATCSGAASCPRGIERRGPDGRFRGCDGPRTRPAHTRWHSGPPAVRSPGPAPRGLALAAVVQIARLTPSPCSCNRAAAASFWLPWAPSNSSRRATSLVSPNAPSARMAAEPIVVGSWEIMAITAGLAALSPRSAKALSSPTWASAESLGISATKRRVASAPLTPVANLLQADLAGIPVLVGHEAAYRLDQIPPRPVPWRTSMQKSARSRGLQYENRYGQSWQEGLLVSIHRFLPRTINKPRMAARRIVLGGLADRSA